MTDQEREKRLIEVAMPLEKISEESRREKNIRHGHPSTMQMWFAPRPLAASRAAAYASLIVDPENDESRASEMEFIENLSTWEATTNMNLLLEAKNKIEAQFNGESPKTLDSFSGRGILPLEARRLGCESHAMELNPVPYMANLGILEYPYIFKKKYEDGNESAHESPIVDNQNDENELVNAVKYWSGQVLERVEEELAKLYSDESITYIWARTLPCQNPDCDLEIPLVSQFWLSRKYNTVYSLDAKKNGEISANIHTDQSLEPIEEGNKTAFEVTGSDKKIVPSDGTVQGGSVVCPACNQTFKSERTRELSNEVGFGEKLMVIVENREEKGKAFRLPGEEDFKALKKANRKLTALDDEWIPNEPLPAKGALGIRVTLYEYDNWGELFSPRQKLSLAIFAKEIDNIIDEIEDDKGEEYAKIISTYLSFALNKMANRNSRLSFWANSRVNHTFSTPGLPIRWDFAETNPFSGWTGSWEYSLEWIYKGIKTCYNATGKGKANLGTATRLPYPDDHFDAVLTDPPYYDNIPYAYYSDFFYIWMKRSIGSAFPDVFSTPLTPKNNEIIEDESRHGSEEEAEDFFETELGKAFDEMRRVLKDDGITTIVFAHKSTEAWAQMIRSLLSSGLVVTATWPIHTERHNRPRSLESAALSSSIYFVCRNRSGSEVGYYSDVQEELRDRVHERLDYFWSQGIRGADLLVSAIGPAVQVFGQYGDVKRLSGNQVTVDELLEETQRLVSDYALGKVLEGDIDLGSIDPETRFYILFRWAFANQKEDYDEVRKLAQVNKANTDRLERLGIMEVRKGDASLVPPQKRSIKDPSEIPEGNKLPLVDKIHRAAILWESGRRNDLKSFVEEHCMSEEFWRSAQAISECLPEEESQSQKEKQMLHGLLGYGGQTDFEVAGQSTLGTYTDRGGKQ